MKVTLILFQILVTSKCYGFFFMHLKQGEKVVPHSRPYQVVVTRPQLFCSGVLISTQYVLTAGHCLEKTKEISVVFGVHDYEEPGPNQFIYNCTNFTIHENFKYNPREVQDDLGIIQLPQPVPFSQYVQPIKLAPSDNLTNTYCGQNGILSGWGLTMDSFFEFFILRQHNVTVITNKECSGAMGTTIPDTQMCTDGSLIIGACVRDAGAPFTIDDKLIGIVSYSNLICDSGFPTVYMKISAYRKWIAQYSDVPEID